MKKVVRTLPADVYDALELSALAFGGIGAGDFSDSIGPLCVTGHRWFLETGDPASVRELSNAFLDAGIEVATNDPAVRAINARHGAAPDARVPFSKWCKELNVVRGEA